MHVSSLICDAAPIQARRRQKKKQQIVFDTWKCQPYFEPNNTGIRTLKSLVQALFIDTKVFHRGPTSAFRQWNYTGQSLMRVAGLSCKITLQQEVANNFFSFEGLVLHVTTYLRTEQSPPVIEGEGPAGSGNENVGTQKLLRCFSLGICGSFLMLDCLQSVCRDDRNCGRTEEEDMNAKKVVRIWSER